MLNLKIYISYILYHYYFKNILYIIIESYINILIRLKIFVPLMIMGLSIIVTINIGGGHLNTLDPDINSNSTLSSISNSASSSMSNSTLLYSDIDKLSISNVPSGSRRYLVLNLNYISFL